MITFASKKKRLGLAFVLNLVLLTLVSSSALGQEPVTVTLFHHWLEGREHLINGIIERFEQQNPDIKVEQVTSGPGLNDRRNKLFSMSAAGIAPDVMMIDRLDIPQYSAMAIIAPIEGYVARDGVDLSIFFPPEIETAHHQGSLWALPLTTGTGNQVFYYNKGHFNESGLDPDQFPETWEALEEASIKLSRKEGDAFVRIAYEPWRSGTMSGEIFSVWLLNNGGSLLSEDGQTALFGGPEGVAAAEWVYDYVQSVYGGQSALGNMVRSNGYGDFYDGLVSMWVHGPPLLGLIAANAPDIELGVALPPANSGFDRKNVGFGGWAYAMSSDSKEPEAAWRLLKFLTTDIEAAGWFLEQQNLRPSPIRDVMMSDAYQRDNPHLGVFIDAMLATVSVPPTSVTPEILAEVETILPRVLRGDGPAAQIVPEAARRAQILLDEARNQ